MAGVHFEMQPQWFAAQQRCADTAVNIAKGADTKFNLYLERLGEVSSSRGEEVQDFLFRSTIQLVANFSFAFPFRRQEMMSA